MRVHDVGVLVGRFQVHDLHDAHRDLIARVKAKHEKVVIFLGLSPLMNTTENPLDFEARKQMITDAFPDVNVLYIKDQAQDDRWSRDLDSKIEDLLTPSQRPILYGGRDSFIHHYEGRYDTEELEPEVYVRFSGTDIRKQIARSSTKGTPDFRAGAVWASQSRFPTCYPTVDVAVFSSDWNKILLGRKPHEDDWRLFGGFADPRSVTYEADVRREVREEAGVEITDPKYIGSRIIDDWRYRGEVDKIKTLLFVAQYFAETPRPGDDIAEVAWFDLTDVQKLVPTLVRSHQSLFSDAMTARWKFIKDQITDRKEN